MEKLKKYYAVVETKLSTEMTIMIKAENKKVANEILKKNYNYKKVVSLKMTPPQRDQQIAKNDKHTSAIQSHGRYIKKYDRRTLIG